VKGKQESSQNAITWPIGKFVSRALPNWQQNVLKEHCHWHCLKLGTTITFG